MNRPFLAMSLLAATALGLHAATFYPIAGVTSDTAGTDFFAAANLIEGAGVGYDSAAPHDRLSSSTWVTNVPNGGTGDYFGPTPTPAPRLVFDLGASVLLSEISLWGYADNNGNGMTDFNLRFSTTATFAGPALSFSGMTQPVTPRQSFTFAPVTAQFVELVPTDNLFGVAPPGGDRVGIGEVAFATPEPSTGLLGMLGALFLLRRRR